MVRALLAFVFGVFVSPTGLAQDLKLSGPELTPELRVELENILGLRLENEQLSASTYNQLADVAKRYLRSVGFVDGDVQAILTGDDIWQLQVEPGPTFEILSVQVEVASPPQARLNVDLQQIASNSLVTGEVVKADALITAEQEILDALFEAGFVVASIVERSVTINRDRTGVDVELKVRTGDFNRLGLPTDPSGWFENDFLSSLKTWEDGEVATRSTLGEFVSRLENLDSIRSATLRFDRSDGDQSTTPVIVNLKPTAKNRFEGAVGYAGSEGFGVNAQWFRRNLFRRDETSNVFGLFAELETRIGAGIERPHFGRLGRTLRLNAEAYQLRTDAFDVDGGLISVGFERQTSDVLSQSARTKLQTIRGRDAIGDRRLSTLSFEVNNAFDFRDDPFDPSQGAFFALSTEPAYSWGEESATFVRVVGEARGYVSFGDITTAFRTRMGSLIGAEAQEAPPDLRFYSGGGGSVRGYGYQTLSPRIANQPVLNGVPIDRRDEFEFFGGASLIETTAELRIRHTETWGSAVFIEGGSADLSPEPRFDTMRYAAGFGLRYFTEFGPLRADIAFPIDARSEDEAFQVYVSIGQAF